MTVGREIAVCGIGPVGSFGHGRESWNRMFERPAGPSATVSVETPDGEHEYPAHLAEAKGLADHLPVREFRRLDKLTRMAVLGAILALRDAGMEEMDRSRTGLVLASGFGSTNTTFGFLESRIRYGDRGVSPLLFSNSGNSGPASNTAILLGITGPSMTVCQVELPVLSAVDSACRWLLDDRADVVLVGGLDEYSPVIGYGRGRFLGEGCRGPMMPLDMDRSTSVVGEGCCFLVLGRTREFAGRAIAKIEKIDVGPIESEPPDLEENDILVLGADGFNGYGRHYLPYIKSGRCCVSYAPYYGSFPAAMAFDLAVAATAFRGGRLPRPPEGSANTPLLKRLASRGDGLEGEKIVTINCNSFDRYGHIRMGAVI